MNLTEQEQDLAWAAYIHHINGGSPESIYAAVIAVIAARTNPPEPAAESAAEPFAMSEVEWLEANVRCLEVANG